MRDLKGFRFNKMLLNRTYEGERVNMDIGRKKSLNVKG